MRNHRHLDNISRVTSASSYRLTNHRLPPRTEADETTLWQMSIEDGLISSLMPMQERASDPAPDQAETNVDLGGSMIFPAYVDMHTHLDKGHIWPRAANPDGSFMSALMTVERDRTTRWSADDVRARADFSLRCAFAHGTRAIRTHLDSIVPQDAISWPVFAELREAWTGKIELQMVSLAMSEHYEGYRGRELADRVADFGGILGLVPLMGGDLDDQYDRFLEFAGDRGLDVDLHVDESLDPNDRTLHHLADAVMRTGFEGKVVAGHCCSLTVQDERTALETLDRVAEAGIAMVSLPMCNMYLQDRHNLRTPRLRGVTLLHEIRSRGISLGIASDNTRDPFYAYGDLDMHEVVREAVRIGHLDHPMEGWFDAFSSRPAEIMGLEHQSLDAGTPADYVIFEGRTMSEILSRPEMNRIVIRSGQCTEGGLPDYAELDHLF